MAIIEVKYFNSFILRKTVDIPASGDPTDYTPAYNGSPGIPGPPASGLNGGYPVVDNQENTTLNWAIEESRIRGGYNNTSVSFGARAYLVEDEPRGSVRGNALIYSGIFNSRTGINNTNQFSVGEEITKATDPANGSIQKLYAEDTNLIILSERKVSRALIDKDAIYTAEGQGTSVSQLNLVVGQIVPYAGNFGISKNPESFAVYGYRKYFTDKDRNAVIRLSQDGITEISNYGMIDYFRDNFTTVDSSSFGKGKINGGWDIYTKQYVVSLDPSNPATTYNTLSFDENVKGWTSFYSYKPRFMFSLKSKFYSINADGSAYLYRHNDTSVNRGNFYGVDNKSNITFVVNPNPSFAKLFKTVNYEGSNGWEITKFSSDITGVDSIENNTWILPPELADSGIGNEDKIFSYYEGEYIIDPRESSSTFNQAIYRTDAAPNDYQTVFGNDDPPFQRNYAGFVRKENKYYANLVNNSDIQPGEVVFGDSMTGIKAYYCTVKIQTDSYTNPGGAKELFAVSSEFTKT